MLVLILFRIRLHGTWEIWLFISPYIWSYDRPLISIHTELPQQFSMKKVWFLAAWTLPILCTCKGTQWSCQSPILIKPDHTSHPLTRPHPSLPSPSSSSPLLWHSLWIIDCQWDLICPPLSSYDGSAVKGRKQSHDLICSSFHSLFLLLHFLMQLILMLRSEA